MQRHHGALAKAHQGERAAGQVVALELLVDEALQERGRLVDPEPALVFFPEGQGKPLPAGRRLGATLGRMRRYEGGVRQQVLPGAPELDQVVAVGAVTMEEDDELARRAAGARR